MEFWKSFNDPNTGWSKSGLTAVYIENDTIIHKYYYKIKLLCTHICKPAFVPPCMINLSL